LGVRCDLRGEGRRTIRRLRSPWSTAEAWVETAIAAALKLAAEAEQWGIVAQLANELAVRRRLNGGHEVQPSTAVILGRRRRPGGRG